MSMFASKTQATVALPFDPPHTITIRKLTGREYEETQEVHRAGVAAGRTRSWNIAVRRMLEHGVEDAKVKAAVADPLTGFDRSAIAKGGLVSWTCPEGIEAVADLDDEALEFVATEILRLTKPALFVTTVEQAEADQKNG